MTPTVFLSASVPLQSRDARYYETADIIAIRDSIRALVTALLPMGRLVFGGHPAISPMVALLAELQGEDAISQIVIYQSELFSSDLPKEVAYFKNIRIVDAVRGDSAASLTRMRHEMIGSEDFACGVFIGGMEGVEEEYAIFQKLHPRKPAFPIASTGAAARILFDKYTSDNPDLLNHLTYLSLFRKLLGIKT